MKTISQLFEDHQEILRALAVLNPQRPPGGKIGSGLTRIAGCFSIS
jgi:hypothetical protein